MSDTFETWIGRSLTREDVASERLLAEYRATLAPHLFEGGGEAAPPGFHFGLAPAILDATRLGPDGAEAKGLFLPPIPLPRRMWAGGQVESLSPIRMGARIRRTSRLADLKMRDGKAGRLCVVTITHEIAADGMLAVRERQDLVFREGGIGKVHTPAEPATQELVWTVDGSPLLLFRFSAFTFNGHRIHYDLEHARNVEGYPGLLVHGPMQAALLLNLLASLRGAVPRRFDYRCLAPLVAGAAFTVEGHRGASGPVGRIRDKSGIVTCEATADA
jgi:3-methylfumaryl-CoA hydratase